MELVVLTFLFLFLGGPMMASGFWLAASSNDSKARAMGVSFAILGLAPTFLWLSVVIWALFYSE